VKPYLTRKHSIVVSALEIIDLLGIDGLSMRELARRQGIVEGALYKHFKSKDEILLAVIDYHARYDLKMMNTIKNSTITPKESIMFFINSFAELFESEPAMTCIVSSYEVLLDDSSIVKRVKEIFNSRSDYLTYLVERGQKEGSISADFCGEDLSDIVMGLLRTITLKWRISNYNFSLKTRVVSALEVLLSRF
jgi:AcrR family transcriptional regulator